MNRSIRKTALFVLGVGILAFSVQGAFAQSNDFFSNTILTGERSSGTDGKPGFNPCAGGTTVNSTTCSGAATPPLLDAANLLNLFPKLGPGAITDNMFGKVERPTGNAILACNAGAVFDANLLNCGNAKWDPSTQGQTIPTVGNILNAPMAANTSIDMASCAAGTTETACTSPSIDSSFHHTQLENAFVWNTSTSTPKAIPVNLANMEAIVTPLAATTCAAASGGTKAAVCGRDFMKETTALGTAGKSTVKLATSWAGEVLAADGTLQGTPTLNVNWESSIVQDDTFGGGGVFTQTLQGTFEYNNSPSGFPVTAYPNGQSFTLRSGNQSGFVETLP